MTEIRKADVGWKIKTRKSSAWFGGTEIFTAKEVVVAAGAYNTQKLLHRMKESGTLSKLSSRLGNLSRTNSEALTGALMPLSEIDYSRGAAITSSFHPDEHTHVEPVRYGKGSNSMGLLQTIRTDGWSSKERRRDWRRKFLANPKLIGKILDVRKWSQRTVIALVMQNLNSSVTVFESKSFLGNRKLSSKNDASNPNPTWIPEANEVAERIANNYGGVAGGNIGNLIGSPFTAHFAGGCVIGESGESGVIDPYHRVWGYPTLHIVDGSTITANLGVNPSLTITAQAERAMSLWPNKNQTDSRPVQGAEYRFVEPVEPTNGMRR